MGEHTKGPWTYQPAANYVGFSIAPVGTLPTLASVERPRGNPETCNVQCHNFPGSTEANARLIAAAPELLAEVKITLSDLEANIKHGRCGFYHRPYGPSEPCPICAHRDRLKALVAKATN